MRVEVRNMVIYYSANFGEFSELYPIAYSTRTF